MIPLLSRTSAAIARRPLEYALVTGVVAVTLLMLGSARMLARNLDRMLAGWGEAAHLVVYLGPGAGDDDAARVAATIDQVPGVVSVRRVTPAEAHRRLRDSLGSQAGFLDNVEESFFPDSIEVRLKEGLWPVASVSPLVERLRGSPVVADVEVSGEWADRLGRIRGAVTAASWGALALALFVCVYLVASAARLAAHACRDEIAIQRLVGATTRFVRAPFLVQGALQGLIGALAATGFLSLAHSYLEPRLREALPFALTGRLVFLGAGEVLMGTALVTLTALASASLATRRALDA